LDQIETFQAQQISKPACAKTSLVYVSLKLKILKTVINCPEKYFETIKLSL